MVFLELKSFFSFSWYSVIVRSSVILPYFTLKMFIFWDGEGANNIFWQKWQQRPLWQKSIFCVSFASRYLNSFKHFFLFLFLFLTTYFVFSSFLRKSIILNKWLSFTTYALSRNDDVEPHQRGSTKEQHGNLLTKIILHYGYWESEWLVGNLFRVFFLL